MESGSDITIIGCISVIAEMTVRIAGFLQYQLKSSFFLEGNNSPQFDLLLVFVDICASFHSSAFNIIVIRLVGCFLSLSPRPRFYFPSLSNSAFVFFNFLAALES